MSIQISTQKYVNAHGKEPKGRGRWAFEFQHRDIDSVRKGEQEVLFAPTMFTYREACAWVRKQVRDRGYQDATVYVGS